jgi:hypothetical protein
MATTCSFWRKAVSTFFPRPNALPAGRRKWTHLMALHHPLRHERNAIERLLRRSHDRWEPRRVLLSHPQHPMRESSVLNMPLDKGMPLPSVHQAAALLVLFFWARLSFSMVSPPAFVGKVSLLNTTHTAQLWLDSGRGPK